MKQILNYLLFLTFILSFSSCNLLEEDPKDFVSPHAFFNTEDEVTSALYGVYGYLHNIYIGDYEKIMLGDLGVDVMMAPKQPRLDVFQYYQMESPSSEFTLIWKNHYTAIGAANMVISRTQQSNLDGNFKKRIIAEAKTLRAFYYHALVLMWGDVPVWLDELDINIVSTLPRTSKSDIIDQITKDLDDSIILLPETYENKNLGRITQWAAKSLAARIHLLNNNWQKAYNLAYDIIGNSPHELLTNFSSVFDWKNKFNAELIFVIPCLPDVKGSLIHSFTNPRGRDEQGQFNKLFAKGLSAIRPDGVSVSNSADLFQGWGMMSSSEIYVNSFEDGDTRKAMMDWNSMTMSDGSVVRFKGRDDKGGKGHYILKWIAFDEKSNNGSRDIHHIRLAEIYLIKAEAANELNNSPEAINTLNGLRKRAFGNELHNYPTTLDKDAIKKALVNEHKWELGGEGVRRWYLNHWGYEYLNAAVQACKNENPQGAKNIKPHHILFKIPTEEFVKNSNLGKNNPGY